ncbi:MAG TPA: hypothetical protein PK543_01060 [Candidatus Saccharibacteria bacterium]|nr:hypothetical protein [Candidatus Saccharibacteria bacterium]
MNTSAWQKLLVSIVNTGLVLMLSLPFLISLGFSQEYRIIVVLIFLAYQFAIILTPNKRSLGAVFTNTFWAKKYTLKNHIIYTFLYSLSFSTLFVWIVFPLDLLLVNLLLIQLPMIKKTGYTLHGYLSGKMAGQIKTK